MAHNILKKFEPSVKILNDLIFKLETNLGKNHTQNPFNNLYKKYNYSTKVEVPIKEEEKKE
jgi:hypothetical protein